MNNRQQNYEDINKYLSMDAIPISEIEMENRNLTVKIRTINHREKQHSLWSMGVRDGRLSFIGIHLKPLDASKSMSVSAVINGSR